MNNILFFKSFKFRLISHKRRTHTDNSRGIDSHFLARMKSGSGRIVTLDGVELHLREGDVFYLPLGLSYNSYWTPSEIDGTVEWESYGFIYFPDNADRRYSMKVLAPSKTALSLLDRLSESMTVSAASVGLLYSFLGEIMPQLEQTCNDPKAALLSRASEYILKDPDFRVPELARHCGMSESGLYAFFKSYANISPIGMKNKLQIEKAVELLGSTDLSVEEISDRLNFCSVAYFRKVFKEITGKTPSAIRKEQFQKYNL